jgi:hypothetical protein
MNQITHNRVFDFVASVAPYSTIVGTIYGHVIRLEERVGGHLGKTLNVHPGKDSFQNCMLDCRAIATDYGRKFSIESGGKAIFSVETVEIKKK